jgi:uncharacterized phage protein (TIGR01671 family)
MNNIFRAWDKENNCMVDVDFLGEKVVKITNAEWENIEDFDIMQSTGLKDKNSEEIFEGDYVLIGHPERLGYGNTSIFRIDKVKNLRGYEFSWQRIKGYYCSTHILEDDYSNCEVIGNKYETQLSKILAII